MGKNNVSYQLMTLITTHKLGDKAESIFKKHGLSLQYRLGAEGTASSDIMDMLGLGSVDKCLLLSVLPRAAAQDVLGKLKRELRMHAVNSGIAFTIPLSGASGLLLHLAGGGKEDSERKDENAMTQRTHALVVAMINRGFSGDVMEAAKAAGARGGTVVHSRCIGSAEASALLGLSGQEEKEIVLILTDVTSKTTIMEAVTARCGAATEAKGLVMSLPVDDVTGF
ncbi:MAG: hypothetical protein IJA33_05405 [Oscillospiraceae bacterium]|nr:hypothetical protein [Oscillospiraceae bacterium]